MKEYILALLFLTTLFVKGESLVSAHDNRIEYIGRFNFDDENQVRFSWPGSSILFAVEATDVIQFRMSNYSVADTNHYGGRSFYYLLVDDKAPVKFACGSIDSLYRFSGYERKIHEVRIYKLTETHVGVGAFHGVVLGTGQKLVKPWQVNERRIEFVGNSITCGYGVEGNNQHCDFSASTENNYLSYAAIASRELGLEASFISWSGKGVLRNYDMDSVNTMRLLYDRTIPIESEIWEYPIELAPEVVVINLGTNDFAHSNPNAISFERAYEQLIFEIRFYNPEAKIVCLIGPMMSEGWPKNHHVLSTFSAELKELIDELKLIGMEDLFIFEMSAQGELGYGCDWHPSTAQQEKNGKELAAFLRSAVILQD